MTQTTSILLPILTLLIAPATAGVAASMFFSWLRSVIPYRRFPNEGEVWIQKLLYGRRASRAIVFVLSTLISVAASALVAVLTGQDALAAVDRAFAACLAIVISQFAHMLEMRG